MPQSKTQHSSDDSHVEGREVRRRVVKACQRCRLKKCRCDGSTPCTRCKADDAICAYGRHKKSDKTIFRKGYVQMLERQHTQLIAGLQELYRRTQTGEPWTGPRADPINYGQPLTHKILEALGVLQQDEWDDSEGADGSAWQSFEQQADVLASIYPSSNASPSTQATFSPASSGNQSAFPNSTIMSNRRTKCDVDPMNAVSLKLRMPPPLNTSFFPFTGGHSFPYTTMAAEPAFSTQPPMLPFGIHDTNIDLNGQNLPLNPEMDSAFGNHDMFENLAGEGILLQVGAS